MVVRKNWAKMRLCRTEGKRKGVIGGKRKGVIGDGKVPSYHGYRADHVESRSFQEKSLKKSISQKELDEQDAVY